MSAPGSALPRRARLYLFGIAAAAAAATIPALALASADRRDIAIFLLLAAAAAAAQSLVFELRSNHGFATATLFVLAAAVLLPPGLAALVGALQHVPHLLRTSFPWYIQAFNTASDALIALAAALAVRAIASTGLDDQALIAVGGSAACLVLVALNHGLLAGMLRLARGWSLRETKLFSVESLSIDLVLAALGVVLASVVDVNLALVPAVIAPLFLIHRLLALIAAGDRAVRSAA